MPVYKTEKNGTWYAMVRYKDWKGERKQKSSVVLLLSERRRSGNGSSSYRNRQTWI